MPMGDTPLLQVQTSRLRLARTCFLPRKGGEGDRARAPGPYATALFPSPPWLAPDGEFAHNWRASTDLNMQRTRAVAIAAGQQARQGLMLLAAALLLPALLLLLISP